jgi:hypothetical protein
MNQVTKSSTQNHNPIRLLPVREIDELTAKICELHDLSLKAQEIINKLKDLHSYELRRNPHARADAERDLHELGELPSDLASTLASLDQGLLIATAEQIADGLAVLHGLFASQGDPQIMATTGVEIIEAEQASAIALHYTVLAMLRPPRKTRNHDWEDWERPPLRRFLPTIPEIIAELQDQQKWCQYYRKNLKGLPKRHGQARQELIKRIDELQELEQVAMEFLREMLANGPVDATQGEEAARAKDITSSTLEWALASLKITLQNGMWTRPSHHETQLSNSVM